MTEYLVYDDVSGAFVAVNDLVAVSKDDEVENGSVLYLRTTSLCVYSPLRPREILRRLTIIRYKRDNDPNTGKAENSTRSSGFVTEGRSFMAG